jgi:hypothetical protein
LRLGQLIFSGLVAIGKVGTGDFVPRTDQRGIDAGLARQHRIDQPVGNLGDLKRAFSLKCGHQASGDR